MSNSNPVEFSQATKLIEQGKMGEALEIVKKFSLRAWNLNNQGDFYQVKLF